MQKKKHMLCLKIVRRRFVTSVIATVMLVGGVLSSAQAKFVCVYPDCPGDGPITAAALSSLGSTLSGLFNGFGVILTSLITKGTSVIQGELAKQGQAKIQAQMAIEQYKSEHSMKLAAANVSETQKQPNHICGTLEFSDALNDKSRKVEASVAKSSHFVVNAALGVTNNNSIANLLYKEGQKYAKSKLNAGSNSLISIASDTNTTLMFSDENGNPKISPEQEHAVSIMTLRKAALVAPQQIDANKMDQQSMEADQERRLYASYASGAQVASLFIMSGYR